MYSPGCWLHEMSDRYEYIIIGSGAGGAAAAWRLAQSGRRLLIVEKGAKLPTDGSTLDVDQVFRRAAFISKEPWRTKSGRTITLKEYFNVGGKTKWSGAALIRFQPHEFEAEPDYLCRGSPFCYNDLEPYYTQAEYLLDVRLHEVEPDLRRILDGVHQRDPAWEEHPLPLGLTPEILNHPEELRRFDGGFASARGLKSDAEVSLLDRIKDASHVTLLSDKEAVVLEPANENPKRINAVVCRDGSRYEAATILLAAGALQSPRLLQRYIHENSLFVRSGSFCQIGRNYKQHLNSVVLAVSPHRMFDQVRKTLVLFHPIAPHSSVQAIGPTDGDMLSARLRGFVPHSVLEAIGDRAYGFLLSTEDGSALENRVMDGDRAAYPMWDYDTARVPDARREHLNLCRLMRKQFLRLGLFPFIKRRPIQNTAYACGTLVAGDDPETSVVAADGRVHGFDNLYVVDGSALPRSGRVNPGLTIYAWALRVADLLDRSQPEPDRRSI